jgi:hypothetical protein
VYWIDLLQEVTGWCQPRWECDWAETETVLGTRLPSDYKELCERFGPGEFSSSLWVMLDQGPDSLLSWWKADVEQFERDRHGVNERYAPHGCYGTNGRHGLIQWGSSDAPGRFFWLADAEEDPDSWPVLATEEVILNTEWDTHRLSASEFVYRMVTDPESEPLSMLRPQLPPTFERDRSVSGA